VLYSAGMEGERRPIVGARGTRVAVALVVGAGLLASIPLIATGIPPGHDATLHLKWSTHFTKQLWAGDPFPRWLYGMNAGFGSPTFFYYGPVPYYITSALRRVIPGDDVGWRALGLSAALALIVSGVGALAWLARRAGRATPAATLAAIAYVLLPYHLVIDVYARAAFGELWAFAWLPWVLLGVEEVARGARSARAAQAPLAALAVAYAFLVATHLPTTLFATPVLLALPFAVAPAGAPPGARGGAGERVSTGTRLGAGARVAAALALGAALAAIYLLPALSMQDAVRIEHAPTSHKFYANNFLFDRGGNRPFAEFLTRVGGLTAATYAVAAVALVAGASRERPFWFAIATISVLMMLPVSRPIWAAIPSLQTIQFPWRFNVVLALAVTALLAGAGAEQDPRGRAFRGGRLLAALSALAIAACLFALLGASRQSARERRALNAALVGTEVALGMENPDYRPRWARIEMFAGAPLDALTAPRGARVTLGPGSVRVAQLGPRAILLESDAPGTSEIVVDQFYFPGWRARMKDGTRATIETFPAEPWGLLGLRVPPGRHAIALRPTAGVPGAIGAVVSAAAAAAILALALSGRRAVR